MRSLVINVYIQHSMEKKINENPIGNRKEKSKCMIHITQTFLKYACGAKTWSLKHHPTLLYKDGNWFYNGVWIETPKSKVCPKCLRAGGLLKVECVGCGEFLGYKEGKVPEDSPIVTHSICEICLKKLVEPFVE